MDSGRASKPAMGDTLRSGYYTFPDHLFTGLSKDIHNSITHITKPCSLSRSEKDLDLLESATATAQTPQATKEPLRRTNPRNLMNIPPELHMVILQCLDFDDIQELRRTCKYWHDFATPQMIKTVWGRDAFCDILTSHCKVCKRYCPKGSTRLLTTPLDPEYPLSARCVPCAMRSRDGTIRLGRPVLLGNSVESCVCRWCGWPVTETETSRSTDHGQFHAACHLKYSLGQLVFCFAYWANLFNNIVAPSFCWYYFRSDKMVLVPTIIGALLFALCLFSTGFHLNRAAAHAGHLVMEIVLLGLWVSTP